MESDGDHFLAYYLTTDDESALAFKANRFEATTEQEESKANSFIISSSVLC